MSVIKVCLQCGCFILFWCVLFLFVSYTSVLYYENNTGKSIHRTMSWKKQNFLKDPNQFEIRLLDQRRKTKKAEENVDEVIEVKGRPMIYTSENVILELDSNKYNCYDVEANKCQEKTALFGKLLNMELKRVINAEGKARSKTENNYNVEFRGSYEEREREDLLCAMDGVDLRTIQSTDEPFASLGFPIPTEPLLGDRRFNSCAVVSSAGSLLGSKLGNFIGDVKISVCSDSHDVVIRFNNAPTEGYEEDVGGKTTMRILNSQVVTREEFNFTEEPMYLNISIIVWDPTNFTSTLADWYRRPDYKMFDRYRKFMELNPEADAHMLHPDVLWDLWFVLQSSAPEKIKPNPPSSGFLGIWAAMHRCANVSVLEYVPSVRATARCHYFSEDKDRACSLGSWHPLAQEKLIANKMRDNSDFEAYQRGYINIPGTAYFTCLNSLTDGVNWTGKEITIWRYGLMAVYFVYYF